MKQVVIDKYGRPEEAARCADVPDVGAPGAGEVVFDVLLFPINPADISFCRGTYRLKPALPATPGAECVGRVTAVGAGVTHLKPGDLVINLKRENWTQRRRVQADDVIPIPGSMNLQQAAMLRINPATALLLLTSIVPLKPGEWLIQNVAIKATGAPSYSSQPYPYRNIHDHLKKIYDAFGPARMFWGTDITRMPCSWKQCVTMFTEELPWLKGRDLDLVMGQAVCDWIGWKR